MQLEKSIISLIGNTPLIKIRALDLAPEVELYAKLEGQNPGGSVKDRAAWFMIRALLSENVISSGQRLLEATSGNTGIALAMIAAAHNIGITLVMPDNATPERVKTMRAYGAEVILTPAEKTIEYSRAYCEELLSKGDFVHLDQFNNSNNRLAHFETTGPEIWKQTDQRITHFVSSMGTTGTISGTSSYLKSMNSGVVTIGVQPKTGDRIPGIRKWSEAYFPKIFKSEVVDNIEFVSRKEAVDNAKWLSKNEAIFAGLSTGGAFTIAKKTAMNMEKGCVVFIACDRGDRYLSSEAYS